MNTPTIADRVKHSFRSTVMRGLAAASVTAVTVSNAMAAGEPLDLSAAGTTLKGYAETAASWRVPVLVVILGIGVVKKVVKMVAK